ncbi:MAG: FtsX-like permease family protein [Deltaproteobacteria bacterium]|nr:FtsX-like permease family protein [Deltaproteobacteria bacterium]
MTGPGFEWFVAWRHLRDAERKSYRTLAVGVGLLAFGAACFVAEHFIWKTRPHGLWVARGALLFENLKMIGVVAMVIGVLGTVLGALFTAFTVFTAFSMFGVLLGTGAPIIALSIMSGFELDLKSKIRATKADVVINRADDRPFSDWQSVQARIAGQPGIVESMAYVESEVIVKHISNPAGMGIILRGIEPARATRVLDLARTLKEGAVDNLLHPESIKIEGRAPVLGDGGESKKETPNQARNEAGKEADIEAQIGDAAAPALPSLPPPRQLPGILLGEELFAHSLRVYMGSEVDVACPLCGSGPTGPMPKLKSFRVAGHFYSGMYEFDSKLAYVALEDAQKFLGMQGEVTGIEVRTSNPGTAAQTSDRIAKLLGPSYEVRSWEELNRALFMALRLEKLAMFIVLTFIALVASFSIVSNLIMLVTEKGREVAILKSMGATDGGILRVFFAEGLYIGLVGLGLGLVLGIGTCVLISRFGLPLDPDVYYIQKLPVVMRAGEITSVALAALGLCCLATLYPAFLASRMRPVDGLRYE